MRKVTQRQWYGGLVISFFLILLLTMNYASMVVRPGQVGMKFGMESWEIILMAAVAQLGYLLTAGLPPQSSEQTPKETEG